MKARTLVTIMTLIILIVSGLFAVQVGKCIAFEVWATDPSGTYPVVVASPNWVLIGTTFGENFEEGYSGKLSLEGFLIDSILYFFPASKPKVAVYSGGDSGDIGGMQNVMSGFLTQGYVDSYDLSIVNPSNPMNVSLSALSQYDVVVLDPPTCKGTGWQFIVSEDSITALRSYLDNGGKIIASAYLFVFWDAYTSWGRVLYNDSLTTLFGGVKPDINSYYPSAITSSPFSIGETILTFNAVYPPGSNDPYFHSFWKFDIPAIEAIVEIKPETLNLRSRGVFTAFVKLPPGYDVREIDINTIQCEGALALSGKVTGDTLTVKFDREHLTGVIVGDEVVFTVTGNLYDGTSFSGTDAVRVISPGKK